MHHRVHLSSQHIQSDYLIYLTRPIISKNAFNVRLKSLLMQVIGFSSLINISLLKVKQFMQGLLYIKVVLVICIRNKILVRTFFRLYLSNRKGLTPRSCRMHLSPSITVYSSMGNCHSARFE